MTRPRVHRPLTALGAALAMTALGATTALAPASASPGAEAAGKKQKTVDVQLLAINDFHGALELPTGSNGRIQTGVAADGKTPVTVDAGGVEHLATTIRQLEASQREGSTVVLGNGDLVGASPLLSAAFRDEPTIEAMNLLGMDVATVGNHEFDEGSAELLRLQNGGCHPVDGCADGTPYDGADFPYLSANVTVQATGEPLLAPYTVRTVQGVKVGFVGVVLEGTKDIVSQQGVAGLEFSDEAETTNRYVRELRRKGVQTIVVLLHEGGAQSGTTSWDINGCSGLSGPVTDIVGRMDAEVDVVVTGHTHQGYNCEIDEKIVTSAASNGRVVTDIDLTVDKRTGDVVDGRAENVIVRRTVPADPEQTALIARYRAALGPIASQVVGRTAGPLLKTQEQLFPTGRNSQNQETFALGESPLGNLIADAQLAATDDEQRAVAAFMNPGGVRADLNAGATGEDAVTYEEAFTVQPFANNLVTLDLTGAQVNCLLEQQFQVGRTLYPSATVSYTVDPAGTSAAVGADPCTGTRVVDSSVRIGDAPVAAGSTYRVTVNNFLAGGGDGFSVLTGGTNAVTGPIDLDAFTAYLGANSPVRAPALDRIRLTTEVPA
ncbi:bifunctional metallophosphatase/5'-nucleotidase [Kineococcus sp. NUM-3379]